MIKLAILCQEEPVFLGPFLCDVIRLHPERIVAVFTCGSRSAGEKRRAGSLWLLWRILESAGFLWALWRRLNLRLLGRRSRFSVAGTACKAGIPVYAVGNPNGTEFHRLLREVAPDAVLNQSEKLLKPEVLSIPTYGFLNRHASLLPRFRGRLAGWWAHAAEPPSYGLTIHLVDEGVDTGGIIRQRAFDDIDGAWAYPRVMRHIMRDAPELFWAAADQLVQPGFEPLPNVPVDGTNRFPGPDHVQQYRQALRRRRSRADAAISSDNAGKERPQ